MPSLFAVSLLLMQVGLDPNFGAIPGIPDELRDRPPRTTDTVSRPAAPSRLTQCLQRSTGDAEGALAAARSWRGTARGQERVEAAQCEGFALFGLSRYAEAQSVFASASSEVQDDPERAARLGGMAANAALAAGDPNSALGLGTAALSQARVAQDTDLIGGIARDRSRALVALERLDEAATALAEARSADPDNAEAWLLSATLSRRTDKLAQASSQIAEAARLAPRDPEVGLEAGVIAALAGQDEEARKSFRSVIEVAPGTPFAVQAENYLEQLTP